MQLNNMAVSEEVMKELKDSGYDEDEIIYASGLVMDYNDKNEMKVCMEVLKKHKISENTSDTINEHRVELIKDIKDEDKVCVFGYIRNEAFIKYDLDIPASIIQFIVLYIYQLNEEDKSDEADESQVIQQLKKIAKRHTRMADAINELAPRLPYDDEVNLQVAETMIRHIMDTEDDINLL